MSNYLVAIAIITFANHVYNVGKREHDLITKLIGILLCLLSLIKLLQ